MATFLFDTFVRGGGETSPYNITSHTPNTGSAWSQSAAYPGQYVLSPDGETRGPDSSTRVKLIYNTTAPGSADYTVTANVRFVADYAGTQNDIGITLRTDPTNRSYFYFFAHRTSGGSWTWQCYTRYNGGSFSPVTLGSFTPSFPSTYEMKVSIVGQTAICYVNGTQVGSSQAVDSNVTAAGYVGIFTSLGSADTDASGVHFADITGATAAAATAYTLTGPSSGKVTVASTNFTVTPNGLFTGTVTPASSGSGTFSPASLTWSSETVGKTFTYTPSSTAGSPHTISTTNSGSLTNPSSLSYVVVGLITVTSPVQYRTYQRNRTTNQATFTVSGSIAGFSGSQTVEASFNGSAYATVATGVTSSFSGSFTASSGQGNLTVRIAGDASTAVTVPTVGVGEVILCVGQSNMSGRGNASQTASLVSSKAFTCTLFGNDYTYKALTDPYDSNSGQVDTVSSDIGAAGSYALLLANMLSSALSLPVMLIPAALGGTSQSQWQPGTNHQDRSTLYGSSVYRALQAGGVGAIIWHQGESDTNSSGNPQSGYQAGITAVATAYLADLGTKMAICKLQNYGTALPTGMNSTIQALWDSGVVIKGADLSLINVNGTGDDLHIRQNDQLMMAATLWFRALMNAVYDPVSSSGGQSAPSQGFSKQLKRLR